jgi:hypothetical protein
VSHILRQGLEEHVDGPLLPVCLTGPQTKGTVDDGHVPAGRNDVNMIRQREGLVPDFHHRHGRDPRENFRQDAGVRRSQMLDEDEPQARIRWKVPQQVNEGFQAPGRGPDAHDRERGE